MNSAAMLVRQSRSWFVVHGIYVWAVMAGLLAQGTGSLVLDFNAGLRNATPYLLATIMNGNPPHAWLHVVWGTGGLIYLSFTRDFISRLRLGWVFGTFYTLLGFLGLLVHDPFGMRLELPENVFHLTVGPLMLFLTYMAFSHRTHD